MTVAELIAALSQHNPDLPVRACLSDECGHYSQSVDGVERVVYDGDVHIEVITDE
ncbi:MULTISPECIES: hypothetical protein [Mycobacteriaceae]|uniref:hypothetical protein n=1 Tax=Mycobacteriaceae TaxID=1762 RepID=UPI00148FB114|nr:hypothetical protein [Mycolicibacterium fortuitum]